MNAIPMDEFIRDLNLEVVYPGDRDQILIDTSDLNRPGLQFAGFFDYFAADRIQVVGKVEMTYLEGLSFDTRRERLRRYFQYEIPCVVISRGMDPPPEMIEEAIRYKRPILKSKLDTTKFFNKAINYLDAKLAPRITRHGGLVDVYGVGIMLMGESGIGKSETALELIKRGHRLVADDVVEIKKISDDSLLGEAPETIRHFMEIRGIGIIDIKAMYGAGAVIDSKTIDMVIHLEAWDDNKEYDRLGLIVEYTKILDVQLPELILPVRPGRNLAIIVEVAARNYRLKGMGYNAAQELNKRISQL
ncbi:MAG: HPr(Ser) kinase/phosphatase [Clostridia bacterium]|jgi:HPr kinase/phosphorylase